MNITERAATVLQEIDEQLALADKATAGPWHHRADCRVHDVNGRQVAKTVSPDFSNQQDLQTAAFIASARTVCPTALRCLKTAIEGLLQTRKSAAAIKKIHWGSDGDCGADGRACDIYDFSTDALTTLINQWNSK